MLTTKTLKNFSHYHIKFYPPIWINDITGGRDMDRGPGHLHLTSIVIIMDIRRCNYVLIYYRHALETTLIII